MKKITIRKASLYLQSFFYVTAGINHYLNPEFYLRFIPPYLPNHHLINKGSGVAEMILGLLLLVPVTRTPAVFAIVVMLLAFIPAHIYLIDISKCHTDGFCWPSTIAWLRLLIGQPLLIWWASKAMIVSYERR